MTKLTMVLVLGAVALVAAITLTVALTRKVEAVNWNSKAPYYLAVNWNS